MEKVCHGLVNGDENELTKFKIQTLDELGFCRRIRDETRKAGWDQILEDLNWQEKVIGVYIVGNKGNWKVLSIECYEFMGQWWK